MLYLIFVSLVWAFSPGLIKDRLAGLDSSFVTTVRLAFAVGQVGYKRFHEKNLTVKDREVFAVLYAGGVALALTVMLTRGVSVSLNAGQVMTLLYLGVIASGLGFFFWNVGATRVSSGELAVMNNAKIPLMVAVSLL